MRRAPAAVLVSLVLWVFPLLSFDDATSNPADQLPSIAELENLHFTVAAQAVISGNTYAQASNVRALAIAYSAGSTALSRYREPTPSRGASGIAVFKAVAPAVVVVVVGSVKDNKFDPEGLGTGAVVDPQGYVLTNWHVISGHSEAVVFLKPTNSAELAHAEVRVARVLYQSSTVDLALLKMIDPPSGLQSLSVANMSEIQIAEDIHIIGHPHGNLWSYSTGVISQIRDDYEWRYEDGSRHEAKVLQLQTAINPGNSGGPVVSDSGKILGLVAMSEEGQNLDYAIAADVIKQFVFTGMQMRTRGPAKHEYQAPQQVLVTAASASPQVTKSVYADAILYRIAGKQPGAVVKFKDGTQVRAWDESSNGSFDNWSARLPDGKEFAVAASNGSFIRISAGE